MGKVEEVLRKMLAQGIEVWWPEEGDRRKGATAERADELRSSLVDVRRKKEEMTCGSHNEINIWVLPVLRYGQGFCVTVASLRP